MRTISAIICHSLDTAIDILRVAIYTICYEDCKPILDAFQRYPLTRVSIHHRRLDFNTICLLNNTSGCNGKRIIGSLIAQQHVYHKSLIRRRHYLPSGNVLMDMHISSCSQRYISLIGKCIRIIFRLQCRQNFNAAICLPIFYLNIALNCRGNS